MRITLWLVGIAVAVGALHGWAQADTLEPLPANHAVPTITGTWEGPWTGTQSHPVRMEVKEQKEGKVSGTMTYIFTRRENSNPFSGTFGMKNGKLALLVTVSRGAYTDTFEFATVEGNRLEGTGDAKGERHDHTGPLSLKRR